MSIQSVAERWQSWQDEVVLAVRVELQEVFHSVHCDDFDWDAWRPLFEQGYEPSSAVRQALSAPSSASSLPTWSSARRSNSQAEPPVRPNRFRLPNVDLNAASTFDVD